MLHPSYSDLMKVVNSEVEPGEAPVVNSRYSIVMATSKRARQIIGGEEPLVKTKGDKPLSIAIEELNQAKIRILSEEEAELQRQQEEAWGKRFGLRDGAFDAQALSQTGGARGAVAASVMDIDISDDAVDMDEEDFDDADVEDIADEDIDAADIDIANMNAAGTGKEAG